MAALGFLERLTGSAPPPRKAVVSSARRVNADRTGNTARKDRVREWQRRAIDHYDNLGEIHYAAEFVGRAMAKVRLFVAELDEEGQPVAVENPAVQAVLDRVRGIRGDRAPLQWQWGVLSLILGECRLVLTYDKNLEDNERWEVLSPLEFQAIASGGYKRIVPGAETQGIVEYKQLPDGEAIQDGYAEAWRMWRPHPRNVEEPNSPMRALLDTCDELLLLGLAVRGRARSRAASTGILLWPEDVSFAPGDEVVGPEDLEEDPLLKDIVDAMNAGLTEDGTAASVAPIIVRLAGEWMEKVRLLELNPEREKGYPEISLRGEAVQRIALGLDLPPEVLLGTAGVNHWGAWQIEESTWKSHLEPFAVEMCADFTWAYLMPTLEQRNLQKGSEGYFVWYDDSGVVNAPDRSADALALHKELVISDQALRESTGFSETDIPDDMERRMRVGVKLQDAGLAMGGEPTGLRDAGLLPHDAPPAGGPGATPEPPATGEKGPPPKQPAPSNGGPPAQASAQDLTLAMRAAIVRCRELAGSRILSRCARNQVLRDQLQAVPQSLIAAYLGADAVGALGLNAEDLVSGGASSLSEALNGDDTLKGRADKIVMVVEAAAARGLYLKQAGGVEEL